MAHKVGDRILDVTATTGTGDVTVSGTAVQGHQTPSAVLTSNGDTFDGVVGAGSQWEITRLTRVSANVYSRATTLGTGFQGSSTGSPIDFAAGAKEVWGDIPAFFLRHLNTIEIAIASAAATDIGALHGLRAEITGTTTITGLGTVPNQWRLVRFSGALTLTHHGTSLILPGAANITTAAGDCAIFASDASGNWRCLFYQKAAAAPLGGVAAQSDQETATSLTTIVTPGRQHYHPSAAKYWVNFGADGAIRASHNVTSITDTGTGNWTVNIATDFSSSAWAHFAVSDIWHTIHGGMSAGTVIVRTYSSANAAEDVDFAFSMGFGDQ